MKRGEGEERKSESRSSWRSGLLSLATWVPLVQLLVPRVKWIWDTWYPLITVERRLKSAA